MAVLISKEHCQKLVWSDKPDDERGINPFEEEESDRLFSFEVKKANEQEEDVKLREGFLVRTAFFGSSFALLNLDQTRNSSNLRTL